MFTANRRERNLSGVWRAAQGTLMGRAGWGSVLGQDLGHTGSMDGRAYAASGWASDATLRVIARSLEDGPLRSWLLAQQRVFVGSGLTNVDLRELAPRFRPQMRAAIRDAYHRVGVDGGFEDLVSGQEPGASWIQRLGELVEMLDRFESGEAPEAFNPHMRGPLPASGHKAGPGWDEEPSPGSAA